MGAARRRLIPHRQQCHAVLCLQRRDRLEIFAERGGKAKQGKEQMWERQVSLPVSLSHVTQCFMKTVANLTKKRWETFHRKADLCFFSQVSPRGWAGMKSWGFAFPWVQAVSVRTPYLRLQFFPSHHSWLPSQGLLWVQIRGQLQVSAGEGQLKNLGFVSTRGSQVLLCALGNVGPHFRKPILSPAQHYLLPYQIVCKHPPVWPAERLCL